MAQKIFVAGTEQGSGKTVVALGLVLQLTKMVKNVGYMKPVAIKCPDHSMDGCECIDDDVMIIKDILDNNDASRDICPVTFDQIRNDILDGNKEEALDEISSAYDRLAKDKEVVIVEGTDHKEMMSNLELNINVDVAKKLGCRVLLVVKGGDRSEEDLLTDIEAVKSSCSDSECELLGIVINDVPQKRYEEIDRGMRERLELRGVNLIGVIPSSSLLPHPRISHIIKRAEMDFDILYGEEYLENMVYNYIIGSMQPNNAIPYFSEGCLVITAGDRDDIILSVIAAHMAKGFPNIAGLVLTGGLKPGETISRIMENFGGLNIPVLSVPLDTYSAISKIRNIDVLIEPGDQAKINEAHRLVREFVDIDKLMEYSRVTVTVKKSPEHFLHYIEEKATQLQKHIVFPEGTEERILKAAGEITNRQIARVTLLGPEREIKDKAAKVGTGLQKIEIIEPSERQDLLEKYGDILYEKRKHKGMTKNKANDVIRDNIYFGTVMVEAGDADGLVSGSTHSTALTIRPALQIIKTKPGFKVVSSVFFMLKGSKVFLYGDCGLIEDPTAEELSEIALASIDTAYDFNIEPRVAMLSFSTGDSGKGPMVEKVKKATDMVRKKDKRDVPLEGPIQYDTAIDPDVAKVKDPDSEVAGKANVFIFPDLNSGNIAYKAVQREAGAMALGPILQGLRRQVNDLSRGCSVEDILYVTAITAIQASVLEKES